MQEKLNVYWPSVLVHPVQLVSTCLAYLLIKLFQPVGTKQEW